MAVSPTADTTVLAKALFVNIRNLTIKGAALRSATTDGGFVDHSDVEDNPELSDDSEL